MRQTDGENLPISKGGGLVLEFGIAIPKRINNVRNLLLEIPEDGSNELSVLSRRYLHDLYEELTLKDQHVEKYDLPVV